MHQGESLLYGGLGVICIAGPTVPSIGKLGEMMVGRIVIFAFLIGTQFWLQPAHAQDVCGTLNGAIIVAQDSSNTVMGRIANSFDSGSIFNEFGTYGSEFSSESIWNEFSTFGNKFNSDSPFNEFSSSPPMIIKGGKVIGYLSTNRNIRGSISPNLLKALCRDAL